MRKKLFVSLLFAAPFLMQAQVSSDTISTSTGIDKHHRGHQFYDKDSVKDSTEQHDFVVDFQKHKHHTRIVDSIAQSFIRFDSTRIANFERFFDSIPVFKHLFDSTRHKQMLLVDSGFRHHPFFYLDSIRNKFAYDSIAKPVDPLRPVIVSVFPNPATGVVTVETTETIVSISVISIASKNVVLQVFNTNEFDVTSLPAGVYKVKIVTSNRIFIKTIMKQ